EQINVMNEDATINEIGAEFKGMDRFEAREAIIDELKERDLYLKSEPHKHAIGHCYRCHTMIEPRLSKQWFVKMAPLAKPALKVVKDGKIKFYPKRWTKVYINWMENIRDWCISRQIWWGHRLPVYYCRNCRKQANKSTVDSQQPIDKSESMDYGLWAMDEKGIIVSKVKPEKCPECGSTDIVQDPDVLDTWFSSWLWPFSTFGWPEKTKELDYFYPTDVLVTAQEIIFFWVARMIIAGMEFMKDIPFKEVYIHGTVRDDTGTKMSKSLGNIIDPLDIIGSVGADALRFSIISITAQGQDVFLSPKKFEIGRNFANKLWNASRFVLTNLKEDFVKKDLCQIAKDPNLSLADRWILSRFYQALGDFTKSLESYRINDAANRVYEFIWHEFCDWYIEISKVKLYGDDKKARSFAASMLIRILEGCMRLLHPIMPFITEEI
ncbi:MAG: class I tRNA ligase family protein, partial [Candidatus Omnitrophica bacterium]|nr:class I tRNA ligase family protein [Candidatus Omnitrophota bacterium]